MSLAPPPDEFTKEQLEATPILHFFHYEHLPEDLKIVSRPFCILVSLLIERVPPSAERTMCLRKLLEAKDCAIRSYSE